MERSIREIFLGEIRIIAYNYLCKGTHNISQGMWIEMGQYVYSPAGALKTRSKTIQKCVEYIGGLQGGKGSELGKGIRYLKSRIPDCSGRAIKRAIRTYPRIYKHEFDKYGLDVYYYHIDRCAEIVKEIIEFIYQHSNDDEKKRIFGGVPKEEEYLNLLYEARLSQLRWVRRENYIDQGEQAAVIEQKFENLQR